MRDARAKFVSAILTEANPRPEMRAKAKDADHTSQATAAVTRCRASQSFAAAAGTVRATMSFAVPIARNVQPARSVDPSVRANHPFITMPTAASARAAAVRQYETIERRSVT